MKKKVLFDTSFLVAAFLESHDSHERCLRYFQKVLRGSCEGHVSAHSVAELYAVLTRIPARPKISPSMAVRLVRDNVESKMQVIALSGYEYMSIVADAASLNLSGGVVYDAIIAMCAKKAGVDQLLTLNPDDFQRVWPDHKGIIRTP